MAAYAARASGLVVRWDMTAVRQTQIAPMPQQKARFTSAMSMC